MGQLAPPPVFKLSHYAQRLYFGPELGLVALVQLILVIKAGETYEAEANRWCSAVFDQHRSTALRLEGGDSRVTDPTSGLGGIAQLQRCR